MTSLLLSVDTGRHLGWALFAQTRLRRAGLLDRGDDDARTLRSLVPRVDELFVEVPRVYPGARLFVDPNDLVKVAMCAARIGEAYPTAKFHKVAPSEWKGQEPKPVTKLRVREALSSSELSILDDALKTVTASLRHNVYDAVGIGLWALRRKKGKQRGQS